MSVQAMSWAFTAKTETSAQKVVLLCLANRHNIDTGLCCPSIVRIVEETCASRSTVIRALADLERLQLINRQHHEVNKLKTKNTYTLLIPEVSPRHLEVSPRPGGSVTVTPELEVEPEERMELTLHTGAAPEKSFVAFFVDESRRVSGTDPLKTVLGRVGKTCRDMATAGASDDTIRQAITELVEAGLTVGALPGIVDQLHRGGRRQPAQVSRYGRGMTSAQILSLADHVGVVQVEAG